MTGNIADARELKADLMTDGMGMTALRSSVRARQPVRVGMVTKAAVRAKFMRWAKERVPSSHERIKRIQKTYEMTARRLGLM